MQEEDGIKSAWNNLSHLIERSERIERETYGLNRLVAFNLATFSLSASNCARSVASSAA